MFLQVMLKKTKEKVCTRLGPAATKVTWSDKDGMSMRIEVGAYGKPGRSRRQAARDKTYRGSGLGKL